jgi:hypothetical protein
MKCVHNTETGEVIRVTDEKAAVLVKKKVWEYTDKTHWKSKGRVQG